MLRRFLPFLDLRRYTRGDLSGDVTAAATVTFMSVPQGIAYAMIAGLPPAMGLYAACIPTIVGSLLRSSRHVVTGPTNSLSLLVGTATAGLAGLDPVSTALLLAFVVGTTQVLFGIFRLGVLVDYLSMPVVTGYITGAGVLIGAGQLANLTQTEGGRGSLVEQVGAWASHLEEANGISIGIGLGTAAAILIIRRVNEKIPGTMIALSVATLLSWALDFEALSLRRIADLAPIPTGLPPLTLPGRDWSLADLNVVLPLGVACTVLSLVESSAVARAASTRTRQKLDLSTEFAGQGFANLAAAFFSGFPVSGSLGRTAMNQSAGAATRLAGALGGAFTLVVLLFLGPAVDHTPIAALAGLLLVVMIDLVDVARIRKIFHGRPSDGFAFLMTLLGAWLLRLDQAIYVGIVVSLFMYLRRARNLSVHQIVFDAVGRLVELPLADPREVQLGCPAIHIVNVDGQLFFGAAGELREALEEVIAKPAVRAVILRLRRAHGLDVTTIEAIEDIAARLSLDDRHLFVIGLRKEGTALLGRTGAKARIGEDHIFPTTFRWFEAADAALTRALELIGDHECGAACPIAKHLRAKDITPPFPPVVD